MREEDNDPTSVVVKRQNEGTTQTKPFLSDNSILPAIRFFFQSGMFVFPLTLVFFAIWL